ncbi:NAD-dependent epimerase/dehydratase family protein [Kibdelosporangium philippinense]|uniref:NAD-dependent epimerase/dehydratase family protein n=1 Tax=Kibdelosporangium philippinense TaxID=211113 RepID=A0ABS8ZAJ0_9PSEU|nr:NAD-dependent epimerase/dehydratase family protein [Kibdelosporangium philippinense]MCE7003701.1 NAD-dependent epimerase/dehydratase family protein [Kibdelosporangium philippinense]
MTGIRVVVVGATGNVGIGVVRELTAANEVESVVGVARRPPDWSAAKLNWAEADFTTDDLAGLFRGADVVVHLGWLFQPTRRPAVTWANNVTGGRRVFDAVAEAGVPALVYASSVGAYSPGPKDEQVSESWPTDGWPGAAYPSEKAYLERVLDTFELSHPDIRVVRMRPGFIFQTGAASQQRRLFGGPFLPNRLARPGIVPVVPKLPGLVFQVLHTDDAAAAYRAAVLKDVRGAFNIAADPIVDADVLADCLRAKVVNVPARPVRAALAAAWRLHLVPASPGLFDTVLRVPVMDTYRARTELGWTPRYTAKDAIRAFLLGLRHGSGLPTPPLASSVEGGRWHELSTGVGERP